jgi:hypothetical protein
MELENLKSTLFTDIDRLKNEYTIQIQLFNSFEFSVIFDSESDITNPLLYYFDKYSNINDFVNVTELVENIGKYIMFDKDLEQSKIKANYILQKIQEIINEVEDCKPTNKFLVKNSIKKEVWEIENFTEYFKIYFSYFEDIDFEIFSNIDIYNIVFNRIVFLYENIVNEIDKFNNMKATNINYPIHFLGDTKRDIAYIFWKLRELEMIKCDNLGITLSNFIFYEGNPISNEYFNAEFGKFKNMKFPSNAIDIEEKLNLKSKKNKKL